MSQERVLHVITRLSPGGPALMLRELAQHSSRFEMLIAAGQPHHDEPQYAEALSFDCPVLDIPALRQGRPIRSAVEARASLRELIDTVQPDVVHTHTTVAGFTRAIRHDALKVHTYHGTVHSGHFGAATSLLLKLGERALASTTDAVIAVGEGDAADLARAGITGRDGAVQVIPPPLQQDYMKAPEARDRDGRGRREPVVGFVGRLEPVKRIDVLSEALRIVLGSHPTASVVVLGDGREASHLHGLATSFPGRVRLAGWVADAAAERAGFDVEVLSSDSEGLPMSAIEALAMGTPVVATSVGSLPGLRDLLSGRGLTLVPRRSPEQLAAAVIEAIEHQPDVASSVVRSHFSGRRVAALHEHLYARLLAR